MTEWRQAESPAQIRELMAGRLAVDPAGWLRLDLRLEVSPDGSQLLFCGEPLTDAEALSRFGRITGQLRAEHARRARGEAGLVAASAAPELSAEFRPSRPVDVVTGYWLAGAEMTPPDGPPL